MALLTGASGRLLNLSPARDCLNSMRALAKIGLASRAADGVEIIGHGGVAWNRKLLLDAGNSGTTARLLMGLGAFTSAGGSLTIFGDESLSRRPMERVARYLRPMGVRIAYLGRPGLLPLKVEGAEAVRGISQRIEEPSAQVKSAVLLAGLAAQGITELCQEAKTRDHTEIMLEAMGAGLERAGSIIRLTPGKVLSYPALWRIPGDFSAAAWWAALAAVSGQVLLTGVGVNPTRTGFAEILRAMGAEVTVSNLTASVGEPVADLEVREGELQGVEVDPEVIPQCIDELPALAVTAAFARGRTVVRGAAELKIKESNRLTEIAKVLAAFGASCELLPDGFVVRGGAKLRPSRFVSRDHRITMAASIMAALVPGTSRIGDCRWLDISYPGFLGDLDRVTASGTRAAED